MEDALEIMTVSVSEYEKISILVVKLDHFLDRHAV